MIQIVQKGTGPFVLFFKNDYLCGRFAIVAQLVERWLPKPKVAGSCPVYRSWEGFQKIGALSLFIGLGSQRLVR